MKIYFAGAIRAGRDDQQIYVAMIQLLQHYGTVLTEHVANVGLAGESLPVQQIYTRDRDWVKSADVVVAEVSTPSTGVGYEIGLAEAHQIPVVCLYRNGSERKLSAMVEGNPYCHTIVYETLEQASDAIKKYFTDRIAIDTKT